MSIVSSLSSVWLWLWLWLAAIAAARNNYPATIEVDVLFPRNETYNRNITTIPIVLAIQNGPVAYDAEWRINWNITGASSSKPDVRGSHYSSESTNRLLPTVRNDFRYYFNGDVAIVPMTSQSPAVVSSGKAGSYRLDWEYTVDPCFPEGKSVAYGPMPRVARGSHYFSIVDDDSGSDFDIPLDECPIYGDMWTKASSSSRCPLTPEDSPQDEKKDPCSAQLQTAGQVDCLRDYFFGRKNDTETCSSAFKTVTEDWIEGDSDDDDDASDESVEEDSDSDSDDDDDDDEGAAVSLRPGVFGLGVAAMVVMVLY